jgi:hypothetical protein
MSQKNRGTKRPRKQPASKPLEAALARTIQEIGALIETCSDPADLRRAARVLRSLAYIATLQASARQYRVRGSINQATQQEHAVERIYTELPAEVKW